MDCRSLHSLQPFARAVANFDTHAAMHEKQSYDMLEKSLGNLDWRILLGAWNVGRADVWNVQIFPIPYLVDDLSPHPLQDRPRAALLQLLVWEVQSVLSQLLLFQPWGWLGL